MSVNPTSLPKVLFFSFQTFIIKDVVVFSPTTVASDTLMLLQLKVLEINKEPQILGQE